VSERVRALGLALSVGDRQPSGRPAPYAVCRSCHAPLISTIAFRGFEFYCLQCGRHYGFVQPATAEPTPELQARHRELKAEWDKHAGSKLLIDGWYAWCKKCRPGGEYHPAHATDRELAAHEAALAWLSERASK
jgi:hypothetical protein